MLDNIKKFRKRMILELNKSRGKLGEDMAAMRLSLQGYKVKKVHKGKDFVAIKRHSSTGQIEIKFIEVKTGASPLSKTQKRSKARSKNYEVWRF